MIYKEISLKTGELTLRPDQLLNSGSKRIHSIYQTQKEKLFLIFGMENFHRLQTTED